MSLYVDTLRTLRTVTARGGQVLASLEDLVLRSLLTVVSASSSAQSSVAAAGGLQVLVDNIGFPKAQAAAPLPPAPSRSATSPPPPRVLRGAGARPAEDELRVQLLSVQVPRLSRVEHGLHCVGVSRVSCLCVRMLLPTTTAMLAYKEATYRCWRSARPAAAAS